MVAWKSVLPLIFVAALMIYEEMVSIPSCEVVSRNDLDESGKEDSEEFKVMMVANLLLMGSEASYMNIYFRDSYMTKFFRKSVEILKPDMLVVLGDVSAKGWELTNNKWLSVLQQFQRMLGPFIGLPLHIVLGDRDIGECTRLNAKTISRIASTLPGLDSTGCSAFEVSNVSFVSLNAVAMLCGNNDLRFSVEKVIERESVDLQMHTKSTTEVTNESSKFSESSNNFGGRENAMSSGSGPVLLLHFPLHRTTSRNCGGVDALKSTLSHNPHENSRTFVNRGLAETGPYALLHTLPPNATEYIFQALKPR
ncbi:hypothetical protein HHK36_009448 [Tetracentron sinense]|uniref:Metallophosphoesterase 1 n=1 Tax=Tetracentron sinense TaxID=13715 RepID=A0A834ZDD9_TETSI|nr:hypothetical protein HHK36_009448 [Tetracentron sinense]